MNLYEYECSQPTIGVDPSGQIYGGVAPMVPHWNPKQVQPTPPPGNWYYVPVFGPMWQYLYDLENGNYWGAAGNVVLSAAELAALEVSLEKLLHPSCSDKKDPRDMTHDEECAMLRQQRLNALGAQNWQLAKQITEVMDSMGCDDNAGPGADDPHPSDPIHEPDPVEVPAGAN